MDLPLATPSHTLEWENIHYTTATHVFQKTKSVQFSHAAVSLHPSPAGILASNNTPSISADGNSDLTLNTAQQPTN